MNALIWFGPLQLMKSQIQQQWRQARYSLDQYSDGGEPSSVHCLTSGTSAFVLLNSNGVIKPKLHQVSDALVLCQILPPSLRMSSVYIIFFLSSASSILQVAAVSHPSPPAMRRANISVVTQMSSTQLDEIVPYAQFARAAYCPPIMINGSVVLSGACEAVPEFKVSLTGGNDGSIQYYYVGYWPTENTVVVAHEGTDPAKILADLTDANALTKRLNPTLFSGSPDEHASTANTISKEVKSLISQYNAKSVTLVSIEHFDRSDTPWEPLFRRLNACLWP
ncbi:uncharacterized protein BJ212DRAFT_1330682 [Suillus subaureus]|uniref:Uncharacterized protein n=1 Tax=Suillus subaureus TaxID=48587 RepID=A0A9P7EJH2_9AGAM|nr:uncharacterized protein BJ212DRAFT_1330682 [Suillus subaureus]KAG1822827.1 hypothetical protein BJ212DRAFT_1330682 [Suillus subaureus]